MGWEREAGPREEIESYGPQDPSSGRHEQLQRWAQCPGSRATEKTTLNLPKLAGPQFQTDYLPSTCNAHAQPSAVHTSTWHQCQTSAPPCMAHAATQPPCLAGLLERPPPVPSRAAPCPEATTEARKGVTQGPFPAPGTAQLLSLREGGVTRISIALQEPTFG